MGAGIAQGSGDQAGSLLPTVARFAGEESERTWQTLSHSG